MGKTGTTEWMQIKGSKGQIRLVPKKEGETKKPGPNQRFKAQTTIKRMERAAGRGGRGRGGEMRGGSRGGAGVRGGRVGKGGAGQTQALRTMAARRRMGRPKVSMLGQKQRSK
ncbi:hypothetical protein Mhun_0081 [Methanospirillum hungatei JF-1]|uniref:DUF5350 family protein n=1 Tax=Methanospirillum hungatei JF-1 (strain ATCC 27890 / DSM 864 / NBRC 100397 / JF-1) TaxID=323259 RepID=Q2FQN5_METHJ|nr:DUF5350 domain-containing protein [Methanospirillum hungatei]ABD39859.1 hypothetical protein Mhun_0081 [Methanospirillum hungatei JF-1]MBP9007676.1 DUF5350 domain-containing protein [Methanospirillum sp.]OQA53530.1 MAG: hypothetical protein BWY45_03003 [Euryarchaeota archaeon ADurb.Bin294]HOW04586.1 DUF5350 domain-containing protein [Methanospirillum hungatei]